MIKNTNYSKQIKYSATSSGSHNTTSESHFVVFLSHFLLQDLNDIRLKTNTPVYLKK